MKRHRTLLSFTLLISLAFLFFFVLNAMAQEDSARFMAKSTIAKSPAAKALDQKAKEKLQQMSPEEVQALDDKLANALRLFYEHDYAKALPLFKEVSAEVETMDVLFWLASCAQRAGELDLAIEKYERMLEIDPSLHRVRLDLATTYYPSKKI
jgi:tetratricopeptide (TPR) repeat protein